MKTFNLLACALMLALTSCASPLQRRLERNPALLAKLSESHKASVLAGKVAVGMSREAVFLAWGRPSRIMEGKRIGTSYERWSYTGYDPVYRHDQGFGMSMNYNGIHDSRHGHNRYACDYFDDFYYRAGPQVDYVPFDAKMVEFIGGVVTTFGLPR